MSNQPINTSYYLRLSLVVGENQYVDIPYVNVISLVITESALQIFPTFTLMINDNSGLMETFPLYVNDKIIIGIGKHEESPDMMWFNMTISDYMMIPMFESKSSTMKITGHLTCSELMAPYKNLARRGTSVDVLTQITSEMGHKMISNITTNDYMVWYQIGRNYQFIHHVLDRSHIINDTMFMWFDSYDYVFRVNSLNSIFNSNALFTAMYDINKTNLYYVEPNSTELYYKSYNISNITGHMSRTGGARTSYTETSYTTGLDTEYTVDYTSKTTDYRNVSQSLENISDKSNYGISAGNTYPEYASACIQNTITKKMLYANTMELKVNPLTKVKLMSNIHVDVPSISSGSTDINLVWSGNYVVVGTSHQIVQGGEYNKSILVARNGMNKSLDRKSAFVV